jgi:hypothetical protein
MKYVNGAMVISINAASGGSQLMANGISENNEEINM